MSEELIDLPMMNIDFGYVLTIILAHFNGKMLFLVEAQTTKYHS